MKPTTTREAAYVQTYIKDNSLIKNAPDFAGLFACVTPWGPKPKADSDEIVYEPVFIQDTDTLDRVFGDPRIDPEKYRDLYAVREIVRTGFSVYISKVPSGDPAEFLCLLNDASKTDTSTETLRTDEDGVLLIDGHTKVSDITNGNGMAVLGFETAFGTADAPAKAELDATNIITMRRMGALGNNIAVKVTRESTMQDGVETGSIYTLHIGEKTSDGYNELENLASSGDTVANAFDSNIIVSGSFDKSDADLLTALTEWTALEGGVGNYHGIWKIGDLAKLRNIYGIDESALGKSVIWLNCVIFMALMKVPLRMKSSRTGSILPDAVNLFLFRSLLLNPILILQTHFLNSPQWVLQRNLSSQSTPMTRTGFLRRKSRMLLLIMSISSLSPV